VNTAPERLLDLRGLACPEPVVRTRNALAESGAQELPRLRVLVDNQAAAANVARFAASQGWQTLERQLENGDFELWIEQTGKAKKVPPPAPARASQPAPKTNCGYILYLNRETMGDGDEQLGKVLLKAFLQTLPELEELPSNIILVNGAVRLAIRGAASLAALEKLAAAGCKLLVCGTCLDFYNLKDEVAVGRVSNMFEIAGLLTGPKSVVRP
jgi:selenium metabolism protein YedF